MKTEYEKRMERVSAIKEQIGNQADVAHKAVSVVADHLIEVIDQHLADGADLQKLVGPRGLLKSANAKARIENEALTKMESEYARALVHANEAFPDHFAHLSEMRGAQVPPVSGQRLFTVIKGGGMTPLEPPPPAQPAVDPNRALFDIALARRFQNSGEEL